MITISVFQRTLRGDWQEDDPMMRNQRCRSMGHHFGSCGARDDDDRKHESIMPVNSVYTRSIGFIVVSTVLTLESLFELSYRIPKLST